MRRLVWALPLLGAACANAQTTPYFDLDQDLPVAGLAELSPDAPAVVLSDRRRVKHFLNLSHRGAAPVTKIDTYRALLIRNEAGLLYADVHIAPDDGATPHGLDAATILPNGERVPVPKSSIKHLTLRWLGGGEPFTLTVISFPEATAGAILEYRYYTLAQGIRSRDVYEPRTDLPLMHGEYIVDTYGLADINRSERGMKCSASGGAHPLAEVEYTCTTARRPAEKAEAFTTPNSSPSPFVAYVIRQFSYGYGQSEPVLPDWPTVAKELDEELEKARPVPKEVLERHGDAKTVEEKIASVWQWMQREVRPVRLHYDTTKGFRGVTDLTAGRTSAIDERARMIEAILDELGVPAELVIVTSDSDRSVAERFTDPAFFYRGDWIVKVGDTYLDPYCFGCAPGVLIDEHLGKKAVTMSGLVVDLPEANVGDVPDEHNYELTVSKRGLIVERGQHVMHGASAGGVRWHYYQFPIPPIHLQKDLDRRYLDGIEGGEIRIEGLDKTEGPVRINLHGTLLTRRGYVHAGPIVMVPVDAVFPSGWMYAFAKERKRPVEFNRPPAFKNRFSFRLPAGATVVAKPTPRSSTGLFGRYVLRVATKGERIVVEEEFELTKRTISVADYAAFYAFIDEVRRARAEKLVVEGVGQISASNSSSATRAFLNSGSRISASR